MDEIQFAPAYQEGSGLILAVKYFVFVPIAPLKTEPLVSVFFTVCTGHPGAFDPLPNQSAPFRLCLIPAAQRQPKQANLQRALVT